MHKVNFCFFLDGEYIVTESLQSDVPKVGQLITFRNELRTRSVISVEIETDPKTADRTYVVTLE